jgi:CheY-like chemotaxis protein
MRLELQPVKLAPVVEAALEAVRPVAAARDIRLESQLEPELGTVQGDPQRLQQVTWNLLTNAIKFTPRGGQVTVVVDSAGGFGRLRVTDTGIGIEADFLPHVFTRFSQRDRSITRKYGGLGLGLALVRHLVEVQGGSVHVESLGPGHGSSFTVTFPLARMCEDIEVGPLPALPPQALDRPGKTQRYSGLVDLRVLFVDDDLRTREAVREVLELSGARVDVAGSAAEGATAVDRFDPQVILCDIAMPGEDGYTFMRKLRARESGSGAVIPALALTALASTDDRRRAIAAGFQLHLAKPIDIDRLRDAVLELSRLAVSPGLPAHGVLTAAK